MTAPASPFGPADPADIDVCSNAAYANGVPHRLLARLRAERPIHWQTIPDPRLAPASWVLTRYDHVHEASTMPERLGNRHGLNLRGNYSDADPRHLLNIDDPHHLHLRRLTSARFTPRSVRRFTEHYHDMAARLLDTALAGGEGRLDVVDDVAVPLPLMAICELMGAPPENMDQIVRWSNAIITNDDPEFSPSDEHREESSNEMFAWLSDLFEQRRRAPQADLATVLVDEVRNGALTAEEAAGYGMLLFVAGNETTRTNITHALYQLAMDPAQWDLVVEAARSGDDVVLDRAVEESVRWASPVIYMSRTAYEDIDFHGHTFRAGDKVVLHYASANRDVDVFGPTADRFDVTRAPNPHIGFGFGAHFCLGAHLARLETKALFIELARRAPRLALLGEPTYVRSSFVHGIKQLPLQVRAA